VEDFQQPSPATAGQFGDAKWRGEVKSQKRCSEACHLNLRQSVSVAGLVQE